MLSLLPTGELATPALLVAAVVCVCRRWWASALCRLQMARSAMDGCSGVWFGVLLAERLRADRDTA